MTAALVRDLAVGALAGYAGSRAMDRATTWYWNRMSDASRTREHDANPDGTPLVVGRRVAGLLGRGDGTAAAYTAAGQVHRALGMSYGIAASGLVRRGLPPVAAGIATGSAAFVLVDELAMSTLLPPPWAYPLDSHLRGLVGHLTLGVTAGLVLTAARALGR